MPELGLYGSVRGAAGNSRPYREHHADGFRCPLLAPNGHSNRAAGCRVMELDRRYVVNGTEPNKIKRSKAMASKRALDKLSPTKFGAGAAKRADWIWKIN
jgi:hypothetical protein